MTGAPTDGSVERFPIRFTGAGRAMAVLGLTRRSSAVEVDDDHVRVRMGWGFDVSISRASVRAVAPDHHRVTGWGAHGWRGVWLVNGSSSGIVRIDLAPPVHGRVLVFAIRVRALRVAVEDPDALIVALGPSAT